MPIHFSVAYSSKLFKHGWINIFRRFANHKAAIVAGKEGAGQRKHSTRCHKGNGKERAKMGLGIGPIGKGMGCNTRT